MARDRTGCDPGQPRLVFAVFMIVAGILLFLGNLGWLPIHRIWDYWPLIFVVIGLGRLSGVRRPSSFVTGAMFIVLGTVFTLINVGVFQLHMHDGSWPLSIVFLALGIGGLAKVLDGNVGRRPMGDGTEPLMDDGTSRRAWQAPTDSSPVLDNFALMASINRKVESTAFRGGSLTSLLGSIEIDLRRARFPEGSNAIAIDANAMMGSIKLRIPESWRVDWNGVNVMGSFEDKTTPPITGLAAPRLVVTGYTIMGSVEVES